MKPEKAQLKADLAARSIHLKQELGQHFLANERILAQIVSLGEICASDVVLEIGAGAGTLTEALSRTGAEIHSIEIDERLRPVLMDTFADKKQVHLHFADACKINFNELIPVNRTCKAIANVPYYITTDLIVQVLLQIESLDRLVFLVQEEAAHRLMAVSGKRYAPLNVFCYLLGEMAVPLKVAAHHFVPPPHVHSAVWTLAIRQPAPPLDVRLNWYNFLTACFWQRRKMLKHQLPAMYRVYLKAKQPCDVLDFAGFQADVNRILKSFGLDLSARPEQLSVLCYRQLCQELIT